MLQLVKESTLNGLYNKIDELEKQLQGANAHSKALEEDYLKKLKGQYRVASRNTTRRLQVC